MEVEEKEIEIAPGAFVWAFAFNGTTGALQGDGKLTAGVGENVLIVHA